MAMKSCRSCFCVAKETSLSDHPNATLAVTLHHLSWDQSPFAATAPTLTQALL